MNKCSIMFFAAGVFLSGCDRAPSYEVDCNTNFPIRVTLGDRALAIPRNFEPRIDELVEIKRGMGRHICQTPQDPPIPISNLILSFGEAPLPESDPRHRLTRLSLIIEDPDHSQLVPTDQNVSGEMTGNEEAYSVTMRATWLTEYRREIEDGAKENLSVSIYKIACGDGVELGAHCVDFTVRCSGDDTVRAPRPSGDIPYGRTCSSVFRSKDQSYIVRVRMAEGKRPPLQWGGVPNDIEQLLENVTIEASPN